MRVLLDCRMATWTGVGRYSTGLVRALARRDDLELILFSATGDEPVVEGDNVRTVFSARHPFMPGGLMAFGNFAATVRPDITHCLQFPTPLPFRKPLVVTLHDLTPLFVHGVMESATKRSIYHRLNERAVRLADAIIVVSANTAADVAREFPRAQGKMHIILESADDFSAGEVGPLPGHLAHLATTLYILSMGSTRSHKDIPTLISAFALIAQRNPDLRLVLVGEEVPGFVDQVLPGRPLIAEHVVWTGRVTDAELRALYADATVFAFPSLYEGFGLPPLEAMAMGAPVVVSDSSSLPEVVDDAGLLVPPADPRALAEAIERVLRDEGLREKLVAAGGRRAAQLSWAAAAEATVGVYQEVLGR
jgi:glycosyltransferase involved in cell wall biosynthesis